jgi:hypothetical protein
MFGMEDLIWLDASEAGRVQIGALNRLIIKPKNLPRDATNCGMFCGRKIDRDCGPQLAPCGALIGLTCNVPTRPSVPPPGPSMPNEKPGPKPGLSPATCS